MKSLRLESERLYLRPPFRHTNLTGLSDAASHAALVPRPLAELEAQITELAGHLNAASNRWLVLIAEFDRREAWADGSTPSCAHWLGWKRGIDAVAAREKVRVARALEALPLISAAMARGVEQNGAVLPFSAGAVR